jgi:hypothetical protein
MFRVPRATMPEIYRRVLALGAIGGVLGLTALLGLGRAPGGMVTAIGLLGGAAGAWLILAHLEIGILLLPVVAVLVPFGIGTGTSTSLVASLLLAALLIGLWVGRMVARRGLVLISSPVNVPLAGFTLAAILATISSNVFRDPLVTFAPSFPQIQAGGLSVFIISAGLFLVMMNCLRSTRLLAWLTWIMVGLGTATIGSYFLMSEIDLPFFSVGGLFSLWVVSLSAGQAFHNRTLPLKVRGLLMALVVLWFYRRVFHEFDWLSGWLPMLLALATIAALRSWRLVVSGTIILALLVGLNLDFFVQKYEAQVSGDESQGNFQRLDVWTRVVEVAEGQLWLGLGPAGYAPYYMTYSPDDARSSHSNYLDIFAQTGLIGSFFFLWFLGALHRVAFQARHRWQYGLPAGFAAGALGGLVGMTVAMALGDWVIPFVYNQTLAGFRFTVHNWLILGALAGLPHLHGD